MDFETPIPPRADPALKRFHQFWLECHDGRRLPSRKRLDVDRLIDTEPRCALIGITDEQDRKRFAFVRNGLAHHRMIGRAIENVPLHHIVMPDVWPLVERTYLEICRTRKPHYWQRTGAYVGGRMITYERILCPLADNGVDVDSIVGLWVWLEEGRGTRHGEPPT